MPTADTNIPAPLPEDSSSFRGVVATCEACWRRASASSLYVQLEATSRLLQLKHGSSPSHCVHDQLLFSRIGIRFLFHECVEGCWAGVLPFITRYRARARLITSYAPSASADDTRSNFSLVDLFSSSSSTGLHQLCPYSSRIASPSCYCFPITLDI
jgi:hypothetical protein